MNDSATASTTKKKLYQYMGDGFAWEFTSDNGPSVCITCSPKSRSGDKYSCQLSKDGWYDVLVFTQLTLPVARQVIGDINKCNADNIEIIKKTQLVLCKN